MEPDESKAFAESIKEKLANSHINPQSFADRSCFDEEDVANLSDAGFEFVDYQYAGASIFFVVKHTQTQRLFCVTTEVSSWDSIDFCTNRSHNWRECTPYEFKETRYKLIV